MNTPTTPTTDAYIPGVCNINRAEIAYRQRVGYIISAIFVVMLLAMIALKLPVLSRLVLFVPGMLLADCFLQAKNKFCVSYGAAGQHNANEGGKATTIADKTAVAKDKARARQINLQAAGIGVALTLIALVIPS